MERAVCLIMGYVFGLFQTGYLYSRSKHMDIRNYGSGNSGSTNVLRVMGKKAGLIVFLGDAGKMIVACLLTRLLFRSQVTIKFFTDTIGSTAFKSDAMDFTVSTESVCFSIKFLHPFFFLTKTICKPISYK